MPQSLSIGKVIMSPYSNGAERERIPAKARFIIPQASVNDTCLHAKGWGDYFSFFYVDLIAGNPIVGR